MKGNFSKIMPIGLVVLAFGCASKTLQIATPTPGEVALSKIAGPFERSEGSLWADSTSRPFLFVDLRASHVGDLVTVKVSENAKATKQTGTKSARDAKIKGSLDYALKGGDGKSEIGTGFTNKYDGSGSTSRSGAFTADVPSVITAILPNGNMVIEGVREVLLNNEKEIITIKGIVRPEDIDTTNTIPSSKIADAKIEYTGKGVLNEAARQGWFGRLLNWIAPL
ncbi:MAG: flagellar basal body L-ring protein FlgH [Nitrospirota bacterium]